MSRVVEAVRFRLGRPARELAKRRAMRTGGYCKVFGIGAARTGTSSLARAFVLLGYRHKSWDPALWDAYERGELDPIFQEAERYETFEDGPWNAPDLYRALDERFPRSRFVLTVRETQTWSRSHERHFTSQSTPERYRIENYAARSAELVAEYERRNAEIAEYFRDRPNDLLVLDVVGGEGWEKLCDFLGRRPPRQPFPHFNRGSA
jgi:hypothetical protein